jgi:hypothetical protein
MACLHASLLLWQTGVEERLLLWWAVKPEQLEGCMNPFF